MDGISIAASLIGIGAAGCQIAIKVYTLASQISTASERLSAISHDISLTASALQELGEFVKREEADSNTIVLSRAGLETTKASAAVCESIFKTVENAINNASEQLKTKTKIGGKIKLSKSEKAKWPFLQPSIETLRIDLREAKTTLMIMLQFLNLQKIAAV